jgi:cytochrome b
VRVFHWSLVITFLIAFYTEDDTLWLHVWAGYAVGGLIAFRVVWGFVGTRHARFTDFIYPPVTVLDHLRNLLKLRSKRYLGHSPAGGAMIIAMFVVLSVTVWSGLELYAIKDNAGPLANSAQTVAHAPEAARPLFHLAASHQERGGAGLWEEGHELLANLAMMLVVLHVCGVAFTSFAHRENLVRAMITGRKVSRPGDAG